MTKQSTCPYQTDRLSEYDVVVHLSAEDNDYFLRLALEEPLHGLLKIAQGEVFMPQQEWIWDAEADLEDGQLQFINYNLTPEFPGLPHPYTVEKLCKAVMQRCPISSRSILMYKYMLEKLSAVNDIYDAPESS